MERKIGEIFEYKGEWYQCVRNIKNVCKDCAFFNNTIKDNGKIVGPECYNVPVGSCGGYYRKDGTSICFKKLEKVGEPFTCNYYGDNRLLTIQEYQAYDINISSINNIPMYVSNYKHKRIAIELKQNQENMEEKKNEELSNLENTGKNLKPFDLEAARSGKPVCTRDGRKARIICFDAKDITPIIALVLGKNSREEVQYYDRCGRIKEGKESPADLMMLPEKHEGWINIVKNTDDYYYCKGVFDSEEYARNNEANYPGLAVATVKIEWEE
ncbi:MAG TPA: hypothetical protein H9824_05655 [Candidatus Bacteroides pullicola]|uniref:Uncharacterized protein n=1 Tax=Candidatus Bacteroides pullicola TaxID=2838475 RepID=A0A9D1ZL90_9BACE|nr:hypothetical protein [Candidatus Bacteroides pullicola]